MALTRRNDGRWCKTKTINGKKMYFYSTEPTEKKAVRDIENQMIEYTGEAQRVSCSKMLPRNGKKSSEKI